MAFLTPQEARQAARSSIGVGRLVEAELRKSANTSPSTRFDIFLSHASLDAEIVAGIKVLLERDGLSVYVDWLDDPQLRRDFVTPRTAETLRTRMQHSGYLLYASSEASPNSKWMPWELGFFDGYRPNCVGILPIIPAERSFVGLEYLGLYPVVELAPSWHLGGRFTQKGVAESRSLAQLARRA